MSSLDQLEIEFVSKLANLVIKGLNDQNAVRKLFFDYISTIMRKNWFRDNNTGNVRGVFSKHLNFIGKD